MRLGSLKEISNAEVAVVAERSRNETSKAIIRSFK